MIDHLQANLEKKLSLIFLQIISQNQYTIKKLLWCIELLFKEYFYKIFTSINKNFLYRIYSIKKKLRKPSQSQIYFSFLRTVFKHFIILVIIIL